VPSWEKNFATIFLRVEFFFGVNLFAHKLGIPTGALPYETSFPLAKQLKFKTQLTSNFPTENYLVEVNFRNSFPNEFLIDCATTACFHHKVH
jgi:hypothetical protein